jgi:chaperonin GroES
MNKVIPLEDYVLVQLIEGDEKTAGGLFIPEKARDGQRDARIVKVLAVGPGRVTEYGASIVPGVRAGDLCLIPRMAGTQVEHESSAKLRILRCTEVLAQVEESRIELLK